MFRTVVLAMTILLICGICFARTLPQPDPDDPPKKVSAQLVHKHTADCDKTTAEPVQIICILDRSGSMHDLAEDTIGGYNSFLEKQKQTPGKVEVTTVIFDDRYEKIVDAVDLQKVPELTSAEYYARGNTALLDAVGRTIRETLGKMEKDGICPAKRRVLIMIMTDGLENASTEYSKAQVKALIEATTKEYKWNYTFTGANIDSASEAGGIGINTRHAKNFDANRAGVTGAFSRMSEDAAEVREKGTLSE